MTVDTCSARSLLEGWNLLEESLHLTNIDSHVADVVRLRKPSRKGTRQKLESSLHGECGISSDTRLLLDTFGTTLNLKSEVVHLRQLSRKSTRHLPKLESSHHKVKSLPNKVKNALHKTLATTICTKPVTCTDGNMDSNFEKGWLSDMVSDMPARSSSSTASECNTASTKDLDH